MRNDLRQALHVFHLLLIVAGFAAAVELIGGVL